MCTVMYMTTYIYKISTSEPGQHIYTVPVQRKTAIPFYVYLRHKYRCLYICLYIYNYKICNIYFYIEYNLYLGTGTINRKRKPLVFDELHTFNY